MSVNGTSFTQFCIRDDGYNYNSTIINLNINSAESQAAVSPFCSITSFYGIDIFGAVKSTGTNNIVAPLQAVVGASSWATLVNSYATV